MNVPPAIGMVLGSGQKLTTMGELNTVLGLEDLHDLLEIVMVDAHNQRILAKRSENM